MSTKHILVVDDEKKLAFFLGKALERSNQDCRVSVANSGEEALRILAKNPVDLLITDLRMPGISGLELMYKTREISPDTHLILMTAFGSAKVEEAVLNLQVSRYLTKPFQLTDLLNAVKQLLADMEVNRGGVLAVSEHQFETMAATLRELLQTTGLHCAILADPLGQVLLTEGTPPGSLDISTLVALFAGGFATMFEVARHLKDDTPVTLRYYEGKRSEIYSFNVGTALLLLLLGVKGGRSRLGTVWHYSQRAVKELESLVSAGQDQAFGAMTEGVLEEDFGESFMAELDNVLGTAPSPPKPGEPPAANSNSNSNSDERLSYEDALARGLLGPDFEKD